MKVSDLEKVERILKKLEIAERKHKFHESLTAVDGGPCNLEPKAYIRFGGDIYGNGSSEVLAFNILDIPELVRFCRKMESDSWGVVVGLRAELRTLGVEVM